MQLSSRVLAEARQARRGRRLRGSLGGGERQQNRDPRGLWRWLSLGYRRRHARSGRSGRTASGESSMDMITVDVTDIDTVE